MDDGSTYAVGAAIYVASMNRPLNLTIDSCIFRRCLVASVAASSALGVASAAVAIFTGRDTIVTVTRCSFVNNSVNSSAFGDAGALTIATASRLRPLAAASVTISVCEFRNSRGGLGGALTVKTVAAAVTISNCQFYTNLAIVDGGAFVIDASASLPGAVRVQVSDCNFLANFGGAGTGAVSLYGLQTVFVQRCSFVRNLAGLIGALTLLGALQGQLSDVSFILNEGYMASSLRLFGVAKFSSSGVMLQLPPTATTLVANEGSFGKILSNMTVECPPGSPWTVDYPAPNGTAVCRECPLAQYDIGGTDGFAGEYCEDCPSDDTISCNGGTHVQVSTGFQGFAINSSPRKLLLLSCPEGFCCRDTNCDWDDSCASGRDPSVPLCGACLPNRTEALGTNACVGTCLVQCSS